jgi:hypothetical protein
MFLSVYSLSNDSKWYKKPSTYSTRSTVHMINISNQLLYHRRWIHFRSAFTPKDRRWIHFRSAFTANDRRGMHFRSDFIPNDRRWIHFTSAFTPKDRRWIHFRFYTKKEMNPFQISFYTKRQEIIHFRSAFTPKGFSCILSLLWHLLSRGCTYSPGTHFHGDKATISPFWINRVFLDKFN